jgi:ubiquinone/menaquinone biosynthesis C-methylase UbiE
VRLSGASEPTPYLKRWASRLPQVRANAQIVDLACGAGRNSEFLRRYNAIVTSLDMEPDYAKAIGWNATDPIPRETYSVDLVLCQYLLMFLADREIAMLLDEINRVTRPGSALVVELQTVKSGRVVRLHRVIEYLSMGEHYQWRELNRQKMRCILQKEL